MPGDNHIHNVILSSTRLEKSKAFWQQILHSDVDFSSIPEDYIVSGNGHFTIENASLSLDRELSQRVMTIANQSHDAAFILIFSIILYLLRRYNGQQEVMIGVPEWKSDTLSQEPLNELIPLGILVVDEWSFKTFIFHVKQGLQEVREHSDVPIHSILESLKLSAEGSQHKYIDTIVYAEEIHHSPCLDRLKAGVAFNISFQEEGAKEISINVHYDSERYQLAKISRMLHHIQHLLKLALREPNVPLGQLNILTDEEYCQIVSEFNDSNVAYSRPPLIHERFTLQVEQNADELALRYKNQTLTYSELDSKSNQLARYLRNHKVKRNEMVAVMVNRSEDILIAMLGVLKSGAAFLPIDPAYPSHRIQYMLRDSGVNVVITNLEFTLSYFDGTVIELNHPDLLGHASSSLTNINESSDLAYVLYTSGSTGEPKGVMIEHRSAVNFFDGMGDRIPFLQADCFLALTTISFDIFILETIMPLLCGMNVVIAADEDLVNPKAIGELVQSIGVTVMQLTPSRLQLILNLPDKDISWLNQLRVLMIGGEAFPADQLARLNRLSNAQIYNMYGPTETTIWSAVKQITTDQTITIGKPLANTQMMIVDDKHRLLPVGMPGELAIAGVCVARGYRNKPDMTRLKFVPSLMEKSEKMYMTGDLAKWLSNGEIQFIGRNDGQVKVRGYRIEMSEIETALMKFKGIEKGVVQVREKNGMKYLYAYYVASLPLDESAIKTFLLTLLPEYMVPSFFIALTKFPLTPNGKINKKELPEPLENRSTMADYAAPSNLIEKKLIKVWKSVLEIDHMGVTQDFYELGGNSIMLIKMEAELEKHKFDISSAELSKYRTVRKLAAYLEYRQKLGLPGDPHPSQMMEQQGISEDKKSYYSLDDSCLKGIEPFNDIFYKNCFYNSAFPIALRTGESILPFLINEVAVYRRNDHDLALTIDFLPYKDITEVLTSQGIKVRTKAFSPNIKSDIIESIKQNRPVIIWMDCYYSSIRRDLYGREHWPHTLLIYGFNEKDAVFHVIEHLHRDNLTYQKQTIPFDDVIQAYEGFITRYLGIESEASYYDFEYVESNDNNSTFDYKQQYYRSHAYKSNDIRSGLNDLDRFCDHLQEMVRQENLLKASADKIIQSTNDIINAKRVCEYRDNMLFGHVTSSLSTAILESWIAIRRKLIKYIYTSNYNTKVMNEVVELLMSIREMEKEQVDALGHLISSNLAREGFQNGKQDTTC